MKTDSKLGDNIKYFKAKCGVRYWEDSTINGEEDSQGDLVPCRDGDYWIPIIDIETGVIINWKKGVVADIHYKVCDDGFYSYLDSEQNEIGEEVDSYVPNCLCPKEEGYGDYVIMDIDSEGKIANWSFDFEKVNHYLDIL